jgi:hypothetical protein
MHMAYLNQISDLHVDLIKLIRKCITQVLGGLQLLVVLFVFCGTGCGMKVDSFLTTAGRSLIAATSLGQGIQGPLTLEDGLAPLYEVEPAHGPWSIDISRPKLLVAVLLPAQQCTSVRRKAGYSQAHPLDRILAGGARFHAAPIKSYQEAG